MNIGLGAGLSPILHLQEGEKSNVRNNLEYNTWDTGNLSKSLSYVDRVSMELPHSLVPSPSSVDVAADGILGSRYHAEAGVEAWQSTKWTPTLAVLAVVVAGAAFDVPQPP